MRNIWRASRIRPGTQQVLHRRYHILARICHHKLSFLQLVQQTCLWSWPVWTAWEWHFYNTWDMAVHCVISYKNVWALWNDTVFCLADIKRSYLLFHSGFLRRPFSTPPEATMAFPHLQQPSFLLVNINCPCECQFKAEGPGSSFHQLELSSGCFRVHVMEITLDLGLKSLGLTASAGTWVHSTTGPWFSHLQGALIQMPFSLLPGVWGGATEKDIPSNVMSCKCLHKCVIIITVITKRWRGNQDCTLTWALVRVLSG